MTLRFLTRWPTITGRIVMASRRLVTGRVAELTRPYCRFSAASRSKTMCWRAADSMTVRLHTATWLMRSS